MASFFLILFCMSLGIFFRISRLFPGSTAHVLNRFVIYVSLPAMTLQLLHPLTFGASQIPAIAMAWILFVLGALFFSWVSRRFDLSKKTQGALILTGSLGNTSFVGFPLLEALIGASALSTGILVDQPGTFLVAGTLGILAAGYLSAKRPSASVLFKRIFSFPPFLAVVLSLALHGVYFSPAIDFALNRLAGTLIPLSLVAVGFQLRLDSQTIRRHWKALALGLGFKLLVAPLFFIGLYVWIFHLKGEPTHVILLESAMAPMITAGIIASEYDLDAELASLMIGVGIPLSLITVPLWNKWIAALT